MTSPKTNQKYCPGCEIWYFEHERPKQKFGELVTLPKQDIVLKKTDLAKRNDNSYHFLHNQSIIQSLQTKLYFLSTLLNNETDVGKIKEILTTMKVCLEDISIATGLCNQ
jgi:hypothetical protein